MGQTSHSLLCITCRIPWWDRHHTLLCYICMIPWSDGTNITLSPLLYLYDPLMGQTSHSLLCYICMIPWWDKHHTLSFAISVGSPDGTSITLSFAISVWSPDLMGQTSHSLLCYICVIPWWDKHHTLSFAISVGSPDGTNITLSFAISVGSPDGTNITLSPLLYL